VDGDIDPETGESTLTALGAVAAERMAPTSDRPRRSVSAQLARRPACDASVEAGRAGRAVRADGRRSAHPLVSPAIRQAVIVREPDVPVPGVPATAKLVWAATTLCTWPTL
jgi:hypothetical protein